MKVSEFKKQFPYTAKAVHMLGQDSAGGIDNKFVIPDKEIGRFMKLEPVFKDMAKRKLKSLIPNKNKLPVDVQDEYEPNDSVLTYFITGEETFQNIIRSFYGLQGQQAQRFIMDVFEGYLSNLIWTRG
jgi:hypothetical protein